MAAAEVPSRYSGTNVGVRARLDVLDERRASRRPAEQFPGVGAEGGIVEADELDFRRCLEVQMPYLGPVIGVYTDWTPLTDRGKLFPEDLDLEDPWQFKNVIVR